MQRFAGDLLYYKAEVVRMNRHWVGPSLLSVFLFTVLPGSVSAQSRTAADFRCSQLKNNYERRVSNLKLQQQIDLNDCRAANGKNSVLCRSLKEQQQEEMRRLRQSRDIQLQNCIQDPLF